jgi:large subunit ribosomal protein L22
MKTQATAKFVGTPARKTGLVAALIRGRRALDAQLMLAHTPKRAAVPVGKVLTSAIANAENNHGAKAADLVIDSVLIGPGPTLKRARPRAKGSSAPIMKRSSHITVIVSDGRTSGAKLVRGETSSAKGADAKAAPANAAGAGSVAGTDKQKDSVRQPGADVAEAKNAKTKQEEAK